MLKKETTVKETVIYTYSREVSKQQTQEVSAEDLSDFPTEQVDLQAQYKHHRARKHIWPTLRKVVRAGINFLIRYSVRLFLDLLIEMI